MEVGFIVFMGIELYRWDVDPSPYAMEKYSFPKVAQDYFKVTAKDLLSVALGLA